MKVETDITPWSHPTALHTYTRRRNVRKHDDRVRTTDFKPYL